MNRKKNIILSFLVIICIVLLICVVQLSIKFNDLQKEYMDAKKETEVNDFENISFSIGDEKVERSKDASYKIFFGEWEIVSVVPGWQAHLEVHEELEQYLGTRLFYDVKNFEINGEKVSENVGYEVAIIPTEKSDVYFEDMPTVFKDINDIISQNQNYFIHINVICEGYGFHPVGTSFYIKDSNTIIMEIMCDDHFYYLTCERVSYLENYESIIGPS